MGKVRPALGALCLLVALAGCGGQGQASGHGQPIATLHPATSPATGTSPSASGSYRTPEDVIVAINNAGLSCTGTQRIPDPRTSSVTARCWSGKDAIMARIYRNHDAADQGAHREAEPSRPVVLGQNWTVSGPPGFAKRVQSALGGELIAN